MTALAYILAGALAAAVVAIIALALKALSAKDGQLADRKALVEMEEERDAVKQERDSLTAQLATKTATAADLLLAKSLVESERNTLTKRVTELETKLLATMPVGDEGAAVVNTQVSTPILEETPGNGLEKP